MNDFAFVAQIWNTVFDFIGHNAICMVVIAFGLVSLSFRLFRAGSKAVQ